MPRPREGSWPWLGRFTEPTPIRRLGAIDYVGCRDARGDRALIVTGRLGEVTGEVVGLLSAIADAHARLDHPRIPALDKASKPPSLESPFVALRCDALTDLGALSDTAIQNEDVVIDYAGGAAFVLDYLDALSYAHGVVDPSSGTATCLGWFTDANVLVAETGYHWFLGWGHPVRAQERGSLLADLPQSYTAPEIRFGLPPTPGSDLAGVVAFFHSFDRVRPLPAALGDDVAGGSSSDRAALASAVAELMENAHATRPEDRSIARFVASFERAVAALGIVPDIEVHRRDYARVYQLWSKKSSRGQGSLVVARDARWLRLPANEILRLERRGPARRMVLALATARHAAPGAALSWQELFDAGWRGENADVDAAKNRVYVAIANLRSLGLRRALLSSDAGYFLDPALPLAWSDDEADDA